MATWRSRWTERRGGACFAARWVRARFAALLACVFVLMTWGRTARANGRFPASNYIAFGPTDPNLVVARSTFGYLVSHDRGQNWDWLCELSIGFNGIEDPMYGLFGNGGMSVALAEERSTARGLAPYAARELLDVLQCPPGLAWPATEEEWAGGETPRAVLEIYDAILTATRGLTTTETSLKQSTTRLTRALEELQAQLAAAGQDYHPEWDSPDDVIVVRIADEQGPLPAAAFATRIAAARKDQQLLLSDSEQRILEDALLTRLAQQIHDRTIDARDLIRAMNKEMRGRRMSSGKRVGVSWQLADALDDEQRAVAGLLDSGASRLSPDSLARMRAHFAARIKTERARHRDLPYRELLASVLDYRRWRQFVFQLVSPEGGEETLTRGRHSRLSGGEQSVSLHLPLFAAAHAMLNSARPDAPRLLALDEAFAGVDDTGRGELMSLAAQFDLDLFMTGYDLWATSGAVRAAAHYDLAHSPVQHTVSALLLVWDGTELIADEAGSLAGRLGSPGTRRAAAVLSPGDAGAAGRAVTALEVR